MPAGVATQSQHLPAGVSAWLSLAQPQSQLWKMGIAT